MGASPYRGRLGARPADHAATPHIEDDGQIEEARPGREVGDIRHPEPIRPDRGEVAANQIGRGDGGRISARRALELPAAPPCTPTARMRRATRLRPMRTPAAASSACTRVGPAGARMNRLDLGAQGDVAPGTRRQRPPAPRLVPAGGDPQNPAQGGETM